MKPATGALEKRIEGRSALAEACADLMPVLRRDLCMLTATLDEALFGQAALVDRLRSLGVSNTRARFRIIVHPDIKPRRSTLPLVELSRKLTSRMSFRQLPGTLREERRDLLIVDAQAALLRANPDARQARLFHDRARIRDLLGEFDALWEQCQPAAEFRPLYL